MRKKVEIEGLVAKGAVTRAKREKYEDYERNGRTKPKGWKTAAAIALEEGRLEERLNEAQRLLVIRQDELRDAEEFEARTVEGEAGASGASDERDPGEAL